VLIEIPRARLREGPAPRIDWKAVRQRLAVALYLFPGLALVMLFLVGPLIFVVALSTTNWIGIGVPKEIGLANFTDLFRDQSFVKSLINTIAWTLVGAFIQAPLSTLAALAMMRIKRGAKVIRTILVLPNVIAATALALLWYFIFNPTLGLLNGTLSSLGLSKLARRWLEDPQTALWATMVPFCLYVGFGMILISSAISTIPHEYYESAELDGATIRQQDWHITLPLIRPTVALLVLFNVSYGLRTFEYPFFMTGGGPANASSTMSLYIYNQMIVGLRFGASMAASVVTLLLGAVFMAAVFFALRRSDPLR
jgi:raffinose/stachyose/melibiose transport system permease protein